MINPIILYLLLALGGVGIALSLPRRGRINLQLIGGVIAASAAGLVVLMLSLRAAQIGLPELPNIYFYIFSVLALAAAVRVITHPRPVYAALYFIMTVLASAGLFVLLSAEFLAFALVIVYAGAILITYLFVIMLATQAPTGEGDEALADYDAQAREPVLATTVGFILLAVLTTMLFRGTVQLPPPPPVPQFGDAQLMLLPGRVEDRLREDGEIRPGERILADAAGRPRIEIGPGVPPGQEGVWVGPIDGAQERFIPRADWPEDLVPTNIEGVGFELLAGHPGSIEIAGVILLMAMLGAVVLARKQVQLDEEAKARHAEFLAQRRGGGA